MSNPSAPDTLIHLLSELVTRVLSALVGDRGDHAQPRSLIRFRGRRPILVSILATIVLLQVGLVWLMGELVSTSIGLLEVWLELVMKQLELEKAGAS